MPTFRQVFVVALAFLTIWNATPHIACLCSDGTVLLFCPKMNREAAANGTVARSQAKKSCCSTMKSSACCCGEGKAGEGSSECCTAGCRCTPVLIQGEMGPVTKKAATPVKLEFSVLAFSLPLARLPRITRPDLASLHPDPIVPDDLIVLCERWLI
jgi:hypothetical protein